MSKDTLCFLDGTVQEKEIHPMLTSNTYHEVSEIPYRFFVWNIGRHNFPFPCCVPLCELGYNKYSWQRNINPDTLKFIKVESEEFALALLDAAAHGDCDVDRNRFDEMKKEWRDK